MFTVCSSFSWPLASPGEGTHIHWTRGVSHRAMGKWEHVVVHLQISNCCCHWGYWHIPEELWGLVLWPFALLSHSAFHPKPWHRIGSGNYRHCADGMKKTTCNGFQWFREKSASMRRSHETFECFDQVHRHFPSLSRSDRLLRDLGQILWIGRVRSIDKVYTGIDSTIWNVYFSPLVWMNNLTEKPFISWKKNLGWVKIIHTLFLKPSTLW